MGVAEWVFHFLQFRCATQLHGGIAALDREGELLTGVNADDALHVGEASDRGAVDSRYDIADLKAGKTRTLGQTELGALFKDVGL